MLSSTHASAMPQTMPQGALRQHAELGVGVPPDAFGPVDDEDHILVLGGQGPELMCALLRAGAANVTHLRAYERPEADSASLVIVPRVNSLDWLATALPSIRRTLTVHGRIVLLAGTQPATGTQIRRMLTLHGLSVIHVQTISDGQVISAERPRRQFA
jgi:hypothetical protein